MLELFLYKGKMTVSTTIRTSSDSTRFIKYKGYTLVFYIKVL